MRYEVKLLKSEEGYAVWCPALPGCWSQGVTEADAIANVKDAIAGYLADADARPIKSSSFLLSPPSLVLSSFLLPVHAPPMCRGTSGNVRP
jgi:predicted RNase H-like HicB family nuclease